MSEDCLTLNVIRPSGYDGTPLPVGVVSILYSPLSLVYASKSTVDGVNSASSIHHVTPFMMFPGPLIKHC